jgi:transposase
MARVGLWESGRRRRRAALSLAHPKVKRWIARHKRFHLYFIPTSASWLNLVERWFGEITRKRIRRSVFKSVKELIEASQTYVKTNNQNPKPFV